MYSLSFSLLNIGPILNWLSSIGMAYPSVRPKLYPSIMCESFWFEEFLSSGQKTGDYYP